jgi:hypothetical protein
MWALIYWKRITAAVLCVPPSEVIPKNSAVLFNQNDTINIPGTICECTRTYSTISGGQATFQKPPHTHGENGTIGKRRLLFVCRKRKEETAKLHLFASKRKRKTEVRFPWSANDNR